MSTQRWNFYVRTKGGFKRQFSRTAVTNAAASTSCSCAPLLDSVVHQTGLIHCNCGKQAGPLAYQVS